MRYLTLTLALIGLSVFANAQSSDLIPKDPEAKKILDKLSAKTKTFSTITANFEFKLVNEAEGLNDTQSGSIILKNDKYIVDVGEQQIISNGTLVWAYLKDVKEVQISEVDVDDEESMLNPSTIFTMYETGFKYVKADDNTIAGTSVNVIRMYPLDPSEKPFHTVILNVDKAKNQIHSIEIKSKDGNTFIYTIKDFIGNKEYADTKFEFKTPAGVEEIDLR